jgi:hypothetical protein
MEAFEVEASIAEGEEAVQARLSFVQEKAGELEAHEAEKGIFKRLIPLGLAAMRLYFAERGTGEVGRAVEREDGVVRVREGQLPGFSANNAPLRDHQKAPQTRPGAGVPADARGQSAR